MTLARTQHAGADRDRLMVHARSAQQVLHLLQLPEDAGGDISRTVMLDPALTAAVVRAANSAHLGYSRRIGGVRQASVMLGGTLVASLAAGRVADLVFDPDPPAYPDWLWPHSLAVAAAAAVLAKRTDESVDDAFTAGILHDVGWLLAASNGGALDDGDQDHAAAGAELLSRWNFPDRMVAAVQHHHARPGALVDQLSRVVVAAHTFAREVGAASPESTISKLEALQLVGLTDVRASVIIAEVEQELSSLTSELRGAA
jgi:putative nucleotidyltransferase with HDIG domain